MKSWLAHGVTRAAQMAEAATVPVRIVSLTDAAALEAQLIENLQRDAVHPMEEAQGFKALLDMEEPKYTVEQIAAAVGKPAAYVLHRLKLVDLIFAVVEVFYRNEIGVSHALLLAKLPADMQPSALSACFKEVYNGGEKDAKVLLPVRALRFWIETNVLLLLKDAPFDTEERAPGRHRRSCIDCPNRTGHNKLLFSDFGKQDACTSPSCYQAKVDAHIAAAVAAKPKLVQISTAYGQQREGSPVLPRNQYVAIRDEKPKDKELAQRPEYKTCKFVAEANRVRRRRARHHAEGVREPRLPGASPPSRRSSSRSMSRTMPSGRPSRTSSARNRPSRRRPASVFSLPSAQPSRCV